MKSKNIIRGVIVGLYLFCVCWGCISTDAAHTPDAGKTSINNRGTTVVLPFINMAQVFGSNTGVRSPITSKVFVTGIVDNKAEQYMANELYRMIGRREGVKWGVIPDMDRFTRFGKTHEGNGHIQYLRSIGRDEGTDTIMAGYIYAFRNRVGGSYGVEKPTQVIFELVLIRTDTGRIVWQRSFKETQKSLSEDLMKLKTFIKRRGKWISAKEMASGALKEMLKTLP